MADVSLFRAVKLEMRRYPRANARHATHANARHANMNGGTEIGITNANDPPSLRAPGSHEVPEARAGTAVIDLAQPP